MIDKEETKVQLEQPRSYSKFEECIILLIAKFFSKEKDIKKLGEWLEKYLKKGDDETMKVQEEIQKEKENEYCRKCKHRSIGNRGVCVSDCTCENYDKLEEVEE
mgnify:CR=1 FL=1